VEIYVLDDRLGGYFRRYQLALRMMSHGARTQTVIAWTGLTRDQLVTQRRRWGFGPEDRQRGPAPRAFHVFFRSRRHQAEASLFASLCRILGAIPRDAPRSRREWVELLPNVESGERLCEALEAFQEWESKADLDFERAVLLAIGVMHAQDVTLAECSDCHGATLVEGYQRTYANCGYCGPGAGSSLERRANESAIQHDSSTKGEPNLDHVPERVGTTHCGAPCRETTSADATHLAASNWSL